MNTEEVCKLAQVGPSLLKSSGIPVKEAEDEMRQKQECKIMGTTWSVFPDGGGSAMSKAIERPREMRDEGWIQLLVCHQCDTISRERWGWGQPGAWKEAGTRWGRTLVLGVPTLGP